VLQSDVPEREVDLSFAEETERLSELKLPETGLAARGLRMVVAPRRASACFER